MSSSVQKNGSPSNKKSAQAPKSVRKSGAIKPHDYTERVEIGENGKPRPVRGPNDGNRQPASHRMPRAQNVHIDATRFNVDRCFSELQPQLTQTLVKLLALLDGVTGSSRQWSACCPTHRDNKPSLSVGISDDGSKILLQCHGGCETEDIVAAVGMQMQDRMALPIAVKGVRFTRRTPVRLWLGGAAWSAVAGFWVGAYSRVVRCDRDDAPL
jgi:hypothetical protein